MQSWPAPEVPLLPGTGPPVRVRDTSSGGLVPAAVGPEARFYVCGITPYDATHLGHANTYLTFDLLGRALRDAGVAVHYVQNVTDVDDPLLERAEATGEDWRALAARETELFREDMTALRMLPPEHYVGAVEAIGLIAEFIAVLRERGACYDVDADLYFPVAADPSFGAVSRLDRTTMLEVFAERGGDPGRVGKKDPLDALLWRAPRIDEPSWESVVGPGRPGWHVECAAIALDRLGPHLDIMGGGRDLSFPHHEMGASHAHVHAGAGADQDSRSSVRAFVHSGMVAYQGEKMSKSRGNLVFVSRLRHAGVEPAAIRLALLAHHYASDWEWTDADLTQAQKRLQAWRSAVSRPDGPAATDTLAAVRAALAHDLDGPTALGAVDDWAQRARGAGGIDPGAPGVVSRAVDALLGIVL
ncbi:MAG TPA: cysteine--1-D-myo-inosityl 2-amino-2-deoxy-alpha-D-glucopyranoside ligase [Sporichthyaceae bacterium]|jgi:L-cysteine:1D-myo-inositol 2-amino-2-deoxy-alpha-D-glucopyranoside ligase|nr:cysteine--1-D-myo-inosityl 2-amino-2-deoxy-alpha-D-glucopyranoside ligase [Sporichthyaceae bacterium]